MTTTTANKTSILKTPTIAPDLETIRRIAGKLGIDLPETATPIKLVKAMREAFRPRLDAMAKEDWILCNRCGEIADDAPEIDCCPYCGDEGTESGADTKVVQIEDARQKRAPIAVAPSKDLAPAAKKAQDGLVEMKADFEIHDGNLKTGMQTMAKSGYDMGLALTEIHKGELWKTDGHKSFGQYTRSRGISSSLAYSLIDMCKQFDRETYSQIGKKKLMLIASAAPKAQPELIESAKAGASGEELRVAAEATRPARVPRAKEAQSRPASVPPPADDRITLLAKVDPKTKQHYNWRDQDGKHKAAWAKGAHVEIKLSDDVSMFITNKVDKAGHSTGLVVSYDRAES